MTALVGGIISLILGLIGLIYWWDMFIKALMAGIPIILILGGALATYLGIEEWKDSTAQADYMDTSTYTPPTTGASDSEAEKYKAEAEKYKAELEELKQSQEGEKASEE